MSEKRLLQASILLVKSLKTINKQDMLDIGAVADLRSYLVGQESVRRTVSTALLRTDNAQALRDILIDELHSHLYLKSFWCENRWAPYTHNQQSRAYIYRTYLGHAHKEYSSPRRLRGATITN